MTSAGIRSFIAVPLPETIRAGVFAAAQELAAVLPGVRWSRKVENLHVTVKFLGDVADAKLAELVASLSGVLPAVPRFRVELRRMGAFPSARHASVIWAWVDDVQRGLQALAAAVEAAGERVGLPREKRPFTGHVTVGRSKRGGVDARAALDAFADREFGSTDVHEVHLYESKLGGGADNAGSTYVLRHAAALGSN